MNGLCCEQPMHIKHCPIGCSLRKPVGHSKLVGSIVPAVFHFHSIVVGIGKIKTASNFRNNGVCNSDHSTELTESFLLYLDFDNSQCLQFLMKVLTFTASFIFIGHVVACGISTGCITQKQRNGVILNKLTKSLVFTNLVSKYQTFLHRRVLQHSDIEQHNFYCFVFKDLSTEKQIIT